MNNKHYSNLDVLRGIASLMVAAGHAYIAVMFSGEDKIWVRLLWEIQGLQAQFAKLILFFANGAAGVTLFFVLSGAVLGMSLDADKNGVIKKYYLFLVKRIFRIYPAHFFVLCVVCVLLLNGAINSGTFSDSSTWYNWHYRNIPNTLVIFQNLFLWDFSLNPVTWTLAVEVKIAIVFPMLYALSRIKYKPFIVQTLFLLFFISLPYVITDNLVIKHLYKFYLGLLIPLCGLRMGEYLAKTPGALLLGIFALLVERQISNGEYIGYEVLSSFGATIIIVYFMYLDDSASFVRNDLMRNLGKYSYSFYLWHFPILSFMYYGIHVNLWLDQLLVRHTFLVATLVCFSSIALAYLFAVYTYRQVEARFMELGRRMALRTYPVMERNLLFIVRKWRRDLSA